MDNFKSNSNNLQVERRKNEPVVSGDQVKKVAKNAAGTFLNDIFATDAKTALNNSVKKTLLPDLKKLLSNVAKNFVDNAIYGNGQSPQANSSWPGVSYSNGWSYAKTNYSQPAQQSMPQRMNIYNINNLIFNDREVCETIIIKMNESVHRYGTVSVGDFYEFAGQQCSYTDYDYGWRDLKDVSVISVRDGYSIQFPKVVPLK